MAHQAPAGLPSRQPKTWVLIADDATAQIYTCQKVLIQTPLDGANRNHYYEDNAGYEMVALSYGDLKAESIDGYQIGHDQRGTSSSSNSYAHNSYEPHGDITDELKRRFSKKISDRLQHAFVEKLFDQLIVVASGKMASGLKGQLSAEVQNSIVAILHKELTHLHGRDLLTHIVPTLKEANV